jgi:hypothetical protein
VHLLRSFSPPVAIAVSAALASATTGAGLQQVAATRIALVAVTDSQNRPLADVETDDFQIDENGRSRDVFEARIADYPVVVLLDNGTGAESDLEAIRGAVAGFIARIGERAVAIGTMARPPEMLATFDDDRSTVLARLRTLGASAAPLAPLEALAGAAHLIQTTGTPFSAVIVVAAPPIERGEPEPAGLLTTILESRTFVHVVERVPPTAPAASRPGTPPRGVEGTLLRDLSLRTGGELTTVYSPVSYAVALDRLADRLAAEFMVEYLVPAGSSPGADVRVGVRIPGLRVRGLGVSR